METDDYHRLREIDFSRVCPTDALVPTDSMFVPWHSSRNKAQGQQGKPCDATLGDNVILNAYMQCAGLRTLHPGTLLPIGVLVLLYNTVFHPDPEKRGSDHPVVQLALHQGLMVQEPDGLAPFALVLGRDVIEFTLVHQ
ncbi:g9290 [Coccomyxa viridis]|uniref:G9290 protein n=2 Tax=Coccomyxa viridis TaxID=1274662 RepID=A0ABP1G2L5_9CHLO